MKLLFGPYNKNASDDFHTVFLVLCLVRGREGQGELYLMYFVLG